MSLDDAASAAIERPGQPRLPEPEFRQADKAAPNLLLPPVRKDENDDRLSSRLVIKVSGFRFEGNTVFSDADLSVISAPFENRVVSSSDLHELRHRLTLHYVNAGYINSGALLPDQTIQDGVITFRIVEGELNRVEISGNDWLDSDFVADRLKRGAGIPLNIKTLQEQVQLLHQTPVIKRINAELAPGDKPGQSVLRAQVEEARPYQIGITVNNHRAPSVGAERAEIFANHWNLTGHGDELSLRVGATDGLEDGNISYRFPVLANDAAISLKYERSDSLVVEEPFSNIDIKSDSETFGIGFEYPLRKTLSDELSIGLRLEHRRSNTSLLGIPFSFSPGVVNGESRVSVARLTADWVHRGRDQVIAAYSALSVGLDAWNSTIHDDDLPDSKFVSWLGQFQWAKRFWENKQAIFRANAQWTNQSLLPLEKFAVGGASTVRGYRENQLVRDNGAVLSLELRIPVFGDTNGRSDFQLAPFVDAGYAGNKDYPTPDPKTIYSAGVGLRWDPNPRLHGEIYAAKGFEDVETSGDDLQDDGVHFLLSYQFF